MKKRFTLLIPLLMAVLLAQAQQFRVSPDVMAASGGEGDYQAHKVNWTLGETIIGSGSYNNGDRLVTNGFNQGFDCQWFGIDTIWSPVTNDGGDTLWWEITDVTGPNPHPFNASWCYTSVDDATTEDTWNVQVYPNPTGIDLNVNLTGATAGKTYSAQLFNTIGQQAGAWPLKDGVNRLDVASLPAGMYLLQVADKQGDGQTIRLIKQ